MSTVNSRGHERNVHDHLENHEVHFYDDDDDDDDMLHMKLAQKHNTYKAWCKNDKTNMLNQLNDFSLNSLVIALLF